MPGIKSASSAKEPPAIKPDITWNKKDVCVPGLPAFKISVWDTKKLFWYSYTHAQIKLLGYAISKFWF